MIKLPSAFSNTQMLTQHAFLHGVHNIIQKCGNDTRTKYIPKHSKQRRTVKTSSMRNSRSARSLGLAGCRTTGSEVQHWRVTAKLKRLEDQRPAFPGDTGDSPLQCPLQILRSHFGYKCTRNLVSQLFKRIILLETVLCRASLNLFSVQISSH